MSSILLASLLINCVIFVHGQGSFTNYVNQEKLYTLEDELITISDVIINQEKALHGLEDVHGIYDVTSVIENAKDIHRAVVDAKNFTAFISHPINIYHMTKRLAEDWVKVIKTLQDSKSCAKAMQVKVQNIEDNLPKTERVTKIRQSIFRLQTIHGLQAADMVYLNISGSLPLTPLSLDDAFDFARAAYEAERYKLSVNWLDYIVSNFDENNASFSLTNALNMMSSSNFMMNRPQEAIGNLDKILEMDPGNAPATRNKKFIEERMSSDKGSNYPVKPEPVSKKERQVVRLCGNQILKNTTKEARLFCTFTKDRNAGFFSKPHIQTEVLSLKPTILLFHNITTTSEQKAVQYLGYERMRDKLSKHHYRFPDGLESTWVLDTTRWHWIPKLTKTLESIELTNLYPDPSIFTVKNVGMDGYEIPKAPRRHEYQLGTFVIFLNDLGHEGGEIVFPNTDVKVKPSLGSVLFFDAKANRHATVCPVLGEAEWIAVYPLMDKIAKDVCHRNPVLKQRFR